MVEDGSSPLARGTHHGNIRHFRLSRLIPARAGNTRKFQSPQNPATAHPRSRGEHSIPSRATWLWVGSSPLARGTLRGSSRGLVLVRLIPARAGNTSLTALSSATSPAHPRSRGEHVLTIRQLLPAPGSSPLARGTLDGVEGEQVAARLIPARAGNTFYCTCARHFPTAHPRSRGEHAGVFSLETLTCGSSPLARGTQFTDRPAGRRQRLIPARAGNTRPGVPR